MPRVKIVTLEQAMGCPTRRLDAKHYNRDGTCRCIVTRRTIFRRRVRAGQS